ncbi:WD40 repeat-like protein [Rickenella mellea]|uniref:WD40 repeat-like protein n=1 Tax=Rickenella mellea TaxID=50990 RepID=A0A4Y7PXM7_9AGAM|nr:WD40 repeat-like protein [Rickenella mellea]
MPYQVHPYAKMAWSVLSAAHKVRDRDDRIQQLYKIMDSVYAIVLEAESSRIESHKPLVACMAHQTIECGYFITSYAKDKKFWMRLVKNAMTGADSAIENFQVKFQELKKQFHEEAIRNSEFTVKRTEIIVASILDEVKNLVTEVDLKDMPYATDARFRSDKQCLAGTWEEILDEISDWINNPESSQNVFLLCGAAGTGKSAIAHTIAKRFDLLRHLGSSYCFVRSNQASRHTGNLFSTVAIDLANHCSQFRNALHAIIQGNRSLSSTQDAATQFEYFMLKPAENITIAGPIVVVIDALDESGDPRSRHAVLSSLAKQAANLPANFCVFLTSRLEKDIIGNFFDNSSVIVKHMDNIENGTTQRDIHTYISRQLSNCRENFTEKDYQLLVKKSEGIFQWAFVVCDSIKWEIAGLTSYERFQQFTLLSSGKEPLDPLYLAILKQLFPPNVMPRFRSVMGQIMAAFEPLSVDALAEMRYAANADDKFNSKSSFKDVVTSIVKFMGSLLSGASDDFIPVRALHTSFRDFLTDPLRSEEFFVNEHEQHSTMAHACLNILNTRLHFNICKLETSFKHTYDICNLDKCIKQNISLQLLYSCKYWISHLQTVPLDLNFESKVEIFFYKQFLYWLEVLSMVKILNISSSILSLVLKLNINNDVKDFVKDAVKFVSVFGKVIMQSVPYIYLSALPFAPETSLLAKHYLPHFSQTMVIQLGKAHEWPALQHTLEGHTDRIVSVAYSPDGKYIMVAGSDDNNIRVWDVNTGAITMGPLKGHTGAVISVAYSPNAKHIVSSSWDKTIQVWDANTGDITLGPLKGHTDAIWCVAFSPNGKYILSGSSDKTILMWDAQTGTVILGPLKGHTGRVRCIAFSPNGKHIISGSSDTTILMWNAETGAVSYGPLKGHTDEVRCVAFSPNGKHIISGSYDKTVRVWDTDSDIMTWNLSKDHTDPVGCFALSSDGKHIVSGSRDMTVQVWDADTGTIILGPFKGHFNIQVWDINSSVMTLYSLRHSNFVESVAFSPDSKYIVSGSSEAIQIWNVDTGMMKLGSLKGHFRSATSVAFSTDGKNIESGSSDKTILVWNADTGTVVLGPLKGHTGGVTSVAFSPNDKYIISASDDETIQLWNVNTGTVKLGPLKGHTARVTSVAFSPDGRHIVSGSSDMTILVWNADTGTVVLGPLKGHTGGVTSVAFLPDGKHIVSGSYDSTIQIWRMKRENSASVRK